ncbi:arsenate reductase ArsC [Opitutaceae bacterium]
MIPDPPYDVLVLCTGNSARSVLAEYILRARGRGRFNVVSAGARPAGRIHPLAIRVLSERYGLDARDARSKSWDEFKGRSFHFVITVCDQARESCPVWPGQPIVAHWSSPDPGHVEGGDEECWRFFVAVASQISTRADLFCTFPNDKLFDAPAVGAIGDAHPL